MTERYPLQGLRVLNTRRPEDAEELSRRLQELGADVVELPATRIAPPDDPGPLDRAIAAITSGSPACPAFDWIGFTSAHAVSTFLDRFLELSQPTAGGTASDRPAPRGVRSLAPTKIAAVGRATAQALASYGLTPDLVPDHATGQDLAKAFGDVSGKRILLPRSHIALRDLPEMLAAQGAVVTEVVSYVTGPAQADNPHLDVVLSGQVDAVTCFSPSAVEGLAALVAPRQLSAVLAHMPVACVGETTARAARARGLVQVLVASEATVEGVVQTLVDWRKATGDFLQR